MVKDGAAAALMIGVPVLFTGLFALLFGFVSWSWAPPVAGDWYPYIRAAIALVAAVIGAKIGLFIGSLAVFGLIVVVE